AAASFTVPVPTQERSRRLPVSKLEDVQMIRTTTKDLLRPWIPRPLRRAYSTTREGLYKARLRVAQARDRWAITSLQYRELGTLQFAERRRLVRRLASVNADVFCA